MTALPITARAESAVLECYKNGDCGFCDALKFGIKMAEILLTIAGSLSLLFFVIAGLILIMSQGNPGRIAAGRKIIIGSIIGLIFTYTAWVGVNFIIANFAIQEKAGIDVAQIFGKKWQEIKCQKIEEGIFTPSPTLPSQPPVVVSGCGADIGVSCGGNCGVFKTSGIKKSQCSDASPSLTKLFYNMNVLLQSGFGGNVLKAEDIIITSISDDNGLNYCRNSYPRQCDPDNNIITNCCWHTKNSCHYGGPLKNLDGSYAADIRKYTLIQNQATLLEALVDKADGQFYPEADHFHISVPACGGL